jgi:RNA polymerase sigma factor (sigma-70 family)
MGVHTGEPLLTEEGYVGIHVHRAARIAAVGHGGQVLVSQSTRDLAGEDGMRGGSCEGTPHPRADMIGQHVGESTDIELWDRAVAGDADAFGLLFERHGRAIYNYLFRRCADWSVAEDLTSVVFLDAYRRRKSVRIHDGKVLPWLYGVATNVLRNQRRSRRRHAAALRRLSPPEPEPAFGAAAADRIDAEREMRAIAAALETLPRTDQEVVTLCLWSALSYEDAAVALGVPVGTVRSRLSRARRRLAELTDARAAAVPNERVCQS